MRKADYAALAKIILEERVRASGNTKLPEFWDGYESAVCMIAHQFADRANVDKAEFLKACGSPRR